MQVKNKTAIVSGGASGMGKAMCYLLAKQCANVIVLDQNQAQAQSVAKEVDGIAMICDITSEQDCQQQFNNLPKTLTKQLAININCAGIAPAKRLVGKDGPVSLKWFEQVLQVNLLGTVNVMRLAANCMIQNSQKDAENGVIINTASIAAFDGQIGQSAYSASKAGVVGMTLPLAKELAQFGIRVMTIAPGIIDTPMMQGMPEKVSQALLEQTVFPKRFGQADEFARLALHIIENAMLNGETIRMDGAVRMV